MSNNRRNSLDKVPVKSSVGRVVYSPVVVEYGSSQPPEVNENLTFTVAAEAGQPFAYYARDAGTYDATIDWGDGTQLQSVTSYNDPNLTHTFPAQASYEVNISGLFPAPGAASPPSSPPSWDTITSVSNLGKLGYNNLQFAFARRTSLESFVSGNTDTSNITRFDYMFLSSNNITNLDISTMDTSSAVGMAGMFNGCAFQGDIDVSNLDTSSVTSMQGMFANSGTRDIIGLENLNFESATNMSNFMVNSIIPTSSYDKLLISISNQNVNSGLGVNFGGSKYTPNSPASVAKDYLLNVKNWAISDGGPA